MTKFERGLLKLLLYKYVFQSQEDYKINCKVIDSVNFDNLLKKIFNDWEKGLKSKENKGA